MPVEGFQSKGSRFYLSCLSISICEYSAYTINIDKKNIFHSQKEKPAIDTLVKEQKWLHSINLTVITYPQLFAWSSNTPLSLFLSFAAAFAYFIS